MPLKGRVTNEGLIKSIETSFKEGWTIRPKAFSVSTEAGPLDVTRTMNDMKPLFYTGLISARVVQGPNSIEFICTIPPGKATEVKEIGEIYLIAEDNAGADFLLAFGQPENILIYEPEGSLRMRIIITIANVDISEIYEFRYTQATEINDHNNDPNAHPEIKKQLSHLETVMGLRTLADAFINESFNATSNMYLAVDTTAGPVDIVLPTDAEDFARVVINDWAHNSHVHPITVRRQSGAKIAQKDEDLVIDVDGVTVNLVLVKSNWTGAVLDALRNI